MFNLPISIESVLYFFGIAIISLSVAFFVLLLRQLAQTKSKKWTAPKTKLPKDFIEDESYAKALRILDEARLNSLKIVAQSKVFDEQSRKNIQAKLERISQRQMRSLDDISGQLLRTYTDLLSTEVQNFKENLRDSTVESEQRVDNQIRADYAEIKKEIMQHRDTKIAQIDRAMYRILSQVMSDIFGKVLPMKEHEELILRLLEDAKMRAKFEI